MIMMLGVWSIRASADVMVFNLPSFFYAPKLRGKAIFIVSARLFCELPSKYILYPFVVSSQYN